MTDLLRRFRPFLALPVALMTALLLSGQASAFIYTHTTGQVGPWSWDDNLTTPGVDCKYAATTDGNTYPMTKLIVKPPTVFAADRNSAKVDSRKVSWQFQLQRKLIPDGTWKVIGGSTVQYGTAKDNAAASFTKLVLNHHPKDANNPSWVVRVQVLIKWYKPGGGVEGTVLFRPSNYYSVIKGYLSYVFAPPYCQEVDTNG